MEKEQVVLAPGEMELLEILWDRGRLSISGVHQEFLSRGKKIGYTTVQTRLNRLVDKGVLGRNGQYPAEYEAVLQKTDVSGKYFDLLETLCGGDLTPLMLHLAKKRDFKKSELEVLQKILDQPENKERME